jgi:hypothetical protein
MTTASAHELVDIHAATCFCLRRAGSEKLIADLTKNFLKQFVKIFKL